MYDAPHVRVRCSVATRSDMKGGGAIDSSMTVNAVLSAWPDSVQVFNALGVDACCGGHASLEEAAADAHVNVESLVTALASVARLARLAEKRESGR